MGSTQYHVGTVLGKIKGTAHSGKRTRTQTKNNPFKTTSSERLCEFMSTTVLRNVSIFHW